MGEDKRVKIGKEIYQDIYGDARPTASFTK